MIFVPPPEWDASRRAIVAIVGASLLFGVIMPLLVSVRTTPTFVRALVTLALVAPVLIFVVIHSSRRRRHARQRADFLKRHPTDESDPRVAALGELWKRAGRRTRFVASSPGVLGAPRLRIGGGLRPAHRLPDVEGVRAALTTTLPDDESGAPPGLDWPENPDEPLPATIVSFGEPDAPEVGDLYFEPEIITPTGAIWKQLFWVLPAAALIALWMLDYLHWLPPWIPSIGRMLGSFLYFFVAAAVVLVSWAWKAMLRPRYIRMAPGVIQVLTFGYSRSKPTIRSYPVEPGTLAIFARLGRHLVLTLSRGENQDIIAFSRMRDTKRRIERAWQALLSTAPTPPLSEEELVG